MKNRKIYFIIAVFLMALLISVGSYAYWSWTSNENKAVVFNTSKNIQEYIVYDEGESKFVGDFKVGSSYLDGVHTTVSIYKTSEAANIILYATINMRINEIGTNLANSKGLKWAITSGDSNANGELLASGDFYGSKSNDEFIILDNIEVTETLTSYTVWLWLDEKYATSEMTGEKIDTAIWTQVNQYAENNFEITNLSNNYQVINATVVNSNNNVVSYAVTDNNVEPSTWIDIPVAEQKKIYKFRYIVDHTGTYYIWFKDSSGKVINKEITVNEISTTMPICTFSQFNPSTISLSETSNIELTCTGSNIGNIDLTSEDVTLSSSNVVLSNNIVKERIENGYKYTFTVTGTDTNGSTTLTLPSGKFIDEYGNGNEAIVSSPILVKNLVNITYISYGGSIAENEITLNNLVTNGNFEDGTNGWSHVDSSTVLSTTGGVNNTAYITITPTKTYKHITSNSYNSSLNDIMYISGYYRKQGGGNIRLLSYNSSDASNVASSYFSSDVDTWTKVSSFGSNKTSSTTFSTLIYGSGSSYVEGMYTDWDNIMTFDLTNDFGNGNEPTKEWLDQNISYFDGSAAIYNEDKVTNSNIGTLPVPTREGYTFKGWYTGENGTGTKITESTVLTQNTICYAYWVANTYAVNFDGNMFSMTSYTSNGLTFTYDIENSYLTINGTPTTNTYVFSYSMDMSFTEGDTYKLTEQYISGTYEYSGSSGGSSLTIDVVDSSYANVSTRNNLSPYIVTSTAGTINRTLTINSAGASEGAGFKFRMYFDSPADTVFTNYKIKINFTKNESKTVSFASAYGTMPTPKRAGYTFSGWYTGENGTGTKIDSNTLVSITNAHTLYAKWTQKNYTATFDGNMFSTMNSRTINGLTLTYDYTTSILTINGTPTSTWVMLNYFMGLSFTESDKYTLKLTYDSGSVANAGTGGGSLGVDVKNSSKSNVSTRNYTHRSYITSGSSSSTLTINSAGASEGAGFAYFLWFATPADWTFTDYKIKVNFTKNETKTVTFASAYGTMSTPKRAGYAFKGWYTGENGTGTNKTSTSLVSSASNHTLYAKWSYNIMYVKFKTNGGTLTTKTSSTNSSTGVTTTYTWGTDSNGYITRSTNGGAATNNFVSYRYGVTSIDLPDYNYSKYLKITKTGYNAKSGAEWICESGCSTANKTYSQSALTLSSSNDLCDATNGNCTLVLKVNWIDDIKPSGSVSVSRNSSTITAKISVSDDGSGVKKSYGYLIQTSSTCPTSGYTTSTNTTYNFSISATGTYYVCVKVTDNAGNVAYIKSSAITVSNFLPAFTYTGTGATYETINDGGTNWRIKFKTSGTLKLTSSVAVDIFVVGGGGGGGSDCYPDPGFYCQAGGGGGGGYTQTYSNIALSSGSYEVIIGAGGSSGKNGGISYLGSSTTYYADGGKAGTESSGGDGGSGGGSASCCMMNNEVNYYGARGNGGLYGSNGSSCSAECPYYGDSNGGSGQGRTTCEFGQAKNPYTSGCNSGVTAYSQGGTGATVSANSGNGGNVGGSGSSGIVIIRNKR